jgi:FixJ family two-component response regulator
MMNEIAETVFLVDDDAAVLRAFTGVLEAEGLQVQAFASAEPFLAACTAESAGCIVLDLDLPGLNGIQAQQALLARGIDLPVIFLTGKATVSSSVRALKSGAIDFLEKPIAADALIARVRSAMRLNGERRAERRQREDANEHFQRLTPREHEVLEWLLAGKTAKFIGKQLGISPRTVEVHRKNILLKTAAENLLQLDALYRLAGNTPSK